ncbi:MAG: hypothetical protein GQF41_3826 [Candidatus Rifleibacterium amylolyticum]|nr:MAG: hypothetical protein GQF41_3826 [Candidatus Rifleibacterium amylolyticum]
MKKLHLFASLVLMALAVILTQTSYGAEIRSVTARSGIKLRSEPGKVSKVMANIPLNTQVEVLEYGNLIETIEEIEAPWAKIIYNGQTGWVFSGFLSEEVDPVKETAVCKFKGISVGDYYHFDVEMPDGADRSFWLGRDIKGIQINEENQDQYLGKLFRITWIKTRWYISEAGSMLDVECVVEVQLPN